MSAIQSVRPLTFASDPSRRPAVTPTIELSTASEVFPPLQLSGGKFTSRASSLKDLSAVKCGPGLKLPRQRYIGQNYFTSSGLLMYEGKVNKG